MTKRLPRLGIFFGDGHIPCHSDLAMTVTARAIEHIKPDIVGCLGDMLDSTQFSTHPPTFGIKETAFEDDIAVVREYLDRIEPFCDKLVYIEGNHEYRHKRWAAQSNEGRGTFSMLSIERHLSEGRKDFLYVPYGSADGKYPHYKVNSRLVIAHGWSYAKNAVRAHLALSQGMSMVVGHTHRVDSMMVPCVWHPSRLIHVRSAGCMCRPIPLYGVGNPVEWVNAFVVAYFGRHSDTMCTVPILGNKCILPDGTEINAK